mmetsp:Transcript_49142/g.97657  ORF Transcript_49142/g.97657 Transcript_49142/m.97657 type:complete len:630 (-) Transcript_49142:243-2132(-)
MGQTHPACRGAECQLPMCRGLERESSNVTDSEYPPHIVGGLLSQHFSCCKDTTDTSFEQVIVEQHPVVSSRFGGNRSNPGISQVVVPQLPRKRLLTPHIKHRFGDYYEVGNKLGEGSFGDVYEGCSRLMDPVSGRPQEIREGDVAAGVDWHQTARRRVAVKIFRLGVGDQSAQSQTMDMKKLQSFRAERAMLAGLEHPHIVRMFECFQESRALFIVLELCHGGELYSRLVTRARECGSGGLDELLCKRLFRQMLHAVGYLHAQNIVHRDIKTENFLLFGAPGTREADTLKLCDFGTAARLSEQRPRSMENIGTLSYTAPEVYANKGAALPADNWSLGVVLYVMITGTNPFRMPGRKVDKEETVRRIRSGDFEQRRQSWLNVTASGQDLIKRFLVLDEGQRLTCKRALTHKWLEESPNPSDGGVFSGVPAVLSCVGSQKMLAREAPKVMVLLQHMIRLSAAQRAAIECCALAATEADLNSSIPWRELFIVLDSDQDGRLSFTELAVGLQTLAGSAAPPSLKDGQLEDSIQALDFDGSGYVEWVEWLVIALLSSKGIAEACEPLSTAFRLIDRTAETSDPTTEDATQESISELIASSAPKLTGSTMISGEGACTLQDLRFVLASLEVYEIM